MSSRRGFLLGTIAAAATPGFETRGRWIVPVRVGAPVIIAHGTLARWVLWSDGRITTGAYSAPSPHSPGPLMAHEGDRAAGLVPQPGGAPSGGEQP